MIYWVCALPWGRDGGTLMITTGGSEVPMANEQLSESTKSLTEQLQALAAQAEAGIPHQLFRPLGTNIQYHPAGVD